MTVGDGQANSLLGCSFLLCFISTSFNEENLIKLCLHEGEGNTPPLQLPKVHISMMPLLNHLPQPFHASFSFPGASPAHFLFPQLIFLQQTEPETTPISISNHLNYKQ